MAPDPARNHFIAALPQDPCERLIEIAEPVSLDLKQVLIEQDSLIEHVYYPTSSAVSLLTVMGDGGSIEAGLVGRDGMVGFSVLLGAKSMPWQAIVQMSGDALRVRVRSLLALPELVAPLRDMAASYQTAMLWQATLTIACNRFHAIPQRCARWLLMMNDRDDDDVTEVTHEFLSQMLGVRRQSVTATLRRLEQLGLIERIRQGQIRLLDRAGLEALTCECYRRMFLK